jgi:hypothetical protein
MTLTDIEFLLIKTTEKGKVKWVDSNENPLCPYKYPTAVLRIGPVHYQISMTGAKTGTFQAYNDQGVTLGIFQSFLLATVVNNQIQDNRKSAIFELGQQLAFMADPTTNDGV